MKILNFLFWLCLFSLSIIAQPVEFSRDPFVEITDLTLLDSNDNEVKSFAIKLTGIIWDDENPAAVIQVSGKTNIVYENNTIMWIKINKILSSSIVLEGNDKQYMLKLGEEITL